MEITLFEIGKKYKLRTRIGKIITANITDIRLDDNQILYVDKYGVRGLVDVGILESAEEMGI